jgi:hypothetical protein
MVWKVGHILTANLHNTSRLKIVKVPKWYNPIECDHLLRKKDNLAATFSKKE